MKMVDNFFLYCDAVLRIVCPSLKTQFQVLMTLKGANIEGKGVKCWQPAFSPFSTMFSYRQKQT